MSDFQDRFGKEDKGNSGIPYMLDNIDEQADDLLRLFDKAPDLVKKIFTDDALGGTAKTKVKGRLTAFSGGTTVDSEVVKSTCQAMLEIVNRIDRANEGGKGEEEVQQELGLLTAEFVGALSDHESVLKLVPASGEGTTLYGYLATKLQEGGCNNVFALSSRIFLVPLAASGYKPLSDQIRDRLSGMGVDLG